MSTNKPGRRTLFGRIADIIAAILDALWLGI